MPFVMLGKKFYAHIKPMKAFGLNPMYGILIRKYAIGIDIEILIGGAKAEIGFCRIK